MQEGASRAGRRPSLFRAAKVHDRVATRSGTVHAWDIAGQKPSIAEARVSVGTWVRDVQATTLTWSDELYGLRRRPGQKPLEARGDVVARAGRRAQDRGEHQ